MSVHVNKLKAHTITNIYTIHKYKYTMHNTQIQILPGGDVSACEQEVQGLQERDLQRPGLSQEQRQSCSSDCWESFIMIMMFIMIMIMLMMFMMVL